MDPLPPAPPVPALAETLALFEEALPPPAPVALDASVEPGLLELHAALSVALQNDTREMTETLIRSYPTLSSVQSAPAVEMHGRALLC